jgi:hypothetical protein
MAFLAKAMVAAAAVFATGAAAVLALDLGIGWVWVAITAWIMARLVALSARYAGVRWMVTGAPAAG